MYSLGPRRERRFKVTKSRLALAGIGFFVVLPILLYQIPKVKGFVDWKIAEVRANIKYALSPPQESVFTPNATLAAMVRETIAAYTLTPTAEASLTPSLTLENASSPTPAPTATAIPDQILLTGIRHEYQQRNNCGPTTLAMALSYWGWSGDQRDTAAIMKPLPTDKNVMPYEVVDYVEEQTELKVLVRVGGNITMIKNFIAAGFPVMIEKGLDDPKKGWMGHYQLLAGFNESQEQFNAYDSFTGDFDNGKTLPVPYTEIDEYWRHFNNTFFIYYPPDREAEVLAILGADQDETSNYLQAADGASVDIFQLTGRDLFFAWFNRGTNLMQLADYGGAAQAYDEAFQVYAGLDPDDRPWRVLWYQTGPYFAYYFTGRYYDVINLADQTLSNMEDPVLEESYYWRALAKEALGDVDGAIADLQTSLEYHPDFEPSLYQLNRINASI
jgi:hypothetical protein